MNNSEVAAFIDSLQKTNTDSFPKVKVVTIGNGNVMLQTRPYARSNVQNARTAKNRPIISIETGLEANNFMSNAIAYLFADYLYNSCIGPNCNYDYLIFPNLAGEDAVEFALTNPTWEKTRNPNPGSSCVGTNLLENFKGGDWDQGNSDPCSPKYRGSAIGSAPQGNYQMQKMSDRKNVRLSVTLTKSGGKLSHPSAYKPDLIANGAKYTTLLEAYKRAGTNYTIGSYHSQHGVAHGHPLDFNYKEFKDGYAINVALAGNSEAEIGRTFDSFKKGLNNVIDEWRKTSNFKMEFY